MAHGKIAAVLYLLLGGVLTHDPAYDAIVPKAAYEGVGSWIAGQHYVATGRSSAYDALGEVKGKRTEQDAAAEDSRRRILARAAGLDDAALEDGCYDITGSLSGFATAARFKLEGMDGVFLIGVAKKEQVSAHAEFSPKKARAHAMGLFDDGKYKEAAGRLADLTQRGIQDDETVAYAHAASWYVNLESGIDGTTRSEALEGLAQFYYDRKAYEKSLRHYYDLYREQSKPSLTLLNRLVELCEETKREETARNLRDEIARTYPDSLSLPISDSQIKEEYVPILLSERFLLTTGGATLVEYRGKRYFLSVGTTIVKEKSPEETLRQLKVGRIQAQKEAVTFTQTTKVEAEDHVRTETIVVNKNGAKTASSMTIIDESTMAAVQGIVGSLQDIGTWKSKDGTVFFYALGLCLRE